MKNGEDGSTRIWRKPKVETGELIHDKNNDCIVPLSMKNYQILPNKIKEHLFKVKFS